MHAGEGEAGPVPSATGPTGTGEGFLEHESVEAFGRTLVGRLAAAAAIANDLPAADEYAFLATASFTDTTDDEDDGDVRSFRPAMRRLQRRLLGFAQDLIRHELPRNTPRVDDLDTDPDDVLDRFEAIVDTTDVLLERVVCVGPHATIAIATTPRNERTETECNYNTTRRIATVTKRAV